MENFNRILIEILVYIAEGLRLNRAKLEVEDKGRAVNTEQGLINGYKNLLTMLCGIYHVKQATFDEIYENGSVHESIPDADDEFLEELSLERQRFVLTDEWKILQERIRTTFDFEKQKLWLEAESTRDLDLAHGLRDGMLCYNALFDAIDREVEVRRKKAEARAKKEALFEGDASK